MSKPLDELIARMHALTAEYLEKGEEIKNGDDDKSWENFRRKMQGDDLKENGVLQPEKIIAYLRYYYTLNKNTFTPKEKYGNP